MRNILVILLVISLLACKQEIEKPESLIPREQMKSVIKDFYLYRNLQQDNKEQGDISVLNDLNIAILEKHNLTLEQFKESYKYYVVNNAEYDKLLIEIKDELNAGEYVPKQDSVLLNE